MEGFFFTKIVFGVYIILEKFSSKMSFCEIDIELMEVLFSSSTVS